MSDNIGKTISNFVASQFPEIYREQGPLFVSFVEQYFSWIESRTASRDKWFVDRVSTVSVTNRSANVVGRGSLFTTQFANGDSIAVSKGESTNDYEIFTIKSVANDVFLTLKEDRLPNFTIANTKYATVSNKPNASFQTRHFFDINDIDSTFDEYVIHFKEKYLKNIQFQTITDTKTLVKHSLDLYRSKGTERSIDLLYKIAFGKPAKVYYPGQDIFRLSSGNWHIPRYLELSLSPANRQLINKQIIGVSSGATAFVEEIIRCVSGDRIVETAFISAIKGIFITGEKITLEDMSLEISNTPTIVGSLNELEFNITGAGSDFIENELVDIISTNGRGAVGKVLATSNTAGQLSYELLDGGYGYSANIQVSNTTGNVSIESGNDIIAGAGTLFETEYTVGDYISFWSNTISYDTFEVENIANNTELTVTSVPNFSNTETKAGYTRYFAQTFISDKILSLTDVTLNDNYYNFEYAPFLSTITQPMAFINYESANGNFTVGANVYTYEDNNDLKGTGLVLSVSKKTTSSGLLTISVLSGNCDDTEIFTEANAIGASLSVANGYWDITATAEVVGNYANVTIIANGCSNTFLVGEIITQPTTGARGTVSSSIHSGDECIVSIINSSGIYKNGYNIAGLISGVTGQIVSTSIDFGIINISNTFFTLPGNYIRTDNLEGTLTTVSLGSGASIVFSNTNLLYTEEIEYATDYIYPFLTLELGATSWPFTANTSANLSSIIGDTFSYSNLTIGKVSSIVASSPGTLYNKAPIIRLHEPTVFSFDIPDTLILTVTDSSGFSNGEVITQSDTSARGIIKQISNSVTMIVQNMRFDVNKSFVITSGAANTIVGSSTGYDANVVTIEPIIGSSRLGSDVSVLSELAVAEGAITSVKILDSGFGFVDGEEVTIVGGDKTALGYAILNTHGTGSGYYKSNDGFLSNTKKLSDGYYWQEYSYEVRSGVIDDFKKILKNIVHVAGCKSFDALVYDSVNLTELHVETIINIS